MSLILLISHGEVMWAMRTRLERMSLRKLRDLQESGRMVDQIHNGHILHYTRTNPVSGEILPYFNWMRSVCPWNPKLSYVLEIFEYLNIPSQSMHDEHACTFIVDSNALIVPKDGNGLNDLFMTMKPSLQQLNEYHE